MKLLCHLPGCSKIEVESLRRLYVWLLVPLLGIVLLGLESGLQVATAGEIIGSLSAAVISLLPHGLIEAFRATLEEVLEAELRWFREAVAAAGSALANDGGTGIGGGS